MGFGGSSAYEEVGFGGSGFWRFGPLWGLGVYGGRGQCLQGGGVWGFGVWGVGRCPRPGLARRTRRREGAFPLRRRQDATLCCALTTTVARAMHACMHGGELVAGLWRPLWACASRRAHGVNTQLALHRPAFVRMGPAAFSLLACSTHTRACTLSDPLSLPSPCRPLTLTASSATGRCRRARCAARTRASQRWRPRLRTFTARWRCWTRAARWSRVRPSSPPWSGSGSEAGGAGGEVQGVGLGWVWTHTVSARSTRSTRTWRMARRCPGVCLCPGGGGVPGGDGGQAAGEGRQGGEERRGMVWPHRAAWPLHAWTRHRTV